MTTEVILVTGGNGLVGKAIEDYVAKHPEESANSKWVFASSKDADLRYGVASKNFVVTARRHRSRSRRATHAQQIRPDQGAV